jgi:SAM-dependent methyltransferase
LDEGMSREQKVCRLWSEGAARRTPGRTQDTDWTNSATVQSILNVRVTSSPERDWLDRVEEASPGGLGRALSIGCGGGALERAVVERGMCSSVLGCDIAEGALDLAREAAPGMPIEYVLLDLESDQIPGGPYDTAFAVATLHHIGRLGDVVRKLHSSLRPGGVLIVSEFTGPPRFQWTALQLEAAADVYSFLPWRYRLDYACGVTVPFPARPAVCSMVRSDPSEAVRSNEIEGALGQYFELVEEVPIGGTLLNPVLSGTLGNFDETRPADQAFIRAAAGLEDGLIEAGLLPSDFKLMVYARRDEPVATEGWLAGETQRASLIAAQELEIDELHDRFLELTDECDALRDAIDELGRAAEETEREVEELVRGNASLKKGIGFYLVRRARGRGVQAVPGAPGDAGPGEPSELLPASFGDRAAMASAAARAAARYVRALESGNSLLWVCWLAESLPVPLGSVAVVGLEPEATAAASMLGTVMEAGGDTGACDLVLAGMPAAEDELDPVSGMVKDGGWLALVRFPGREGQLPCPGGFSEEGFFSAPAACHTRATEALSLAEAGDEMAAAVAGLRVYAGATLAGHGLSGEACEVALFRRGPPGRARPSGEVTDIATMQSFEIERLRMGIESRRMELAALRTDLQRATDGSKAVLAEAVRLQREKDILLKRGPLMYLKLVRSRRDGAGQEGR